MNEEKQTIRQQEDKVNKVTKPEINMQQQNKDEKNKDQNIKTRTSNVEDINRKDNKTDDKKNETKKVKVKHPEKEKNEAKDKAKENDSNKEETSTKEQLSEDKEAIYIDRLKRLMAEFDNYRKRNEKEKLDIYDRASSNLLAEMLPIVDNFERALQVETTDKVFYEGVTMIYKQLMSTLEKAHVKVIEAKGKTFDPNLHNAVMHIEDEKYGENEVVEEMQKGYLYKDKVLRYSMVKVAN